jgi:putative membrane protein
MGDMMGGGMMGAMGLWMLLWALVGITVLVLAVVGIIWLVRKNDSPRPTPPTLTQAPEELLRRRYAAGEIDEDEYLRRRSGLS